MVGISAATVFFLFNGSADADTHQVSEIAESQSSHHAQGYENADEPEWWYWSRRLVAAEDTLAQWIMALFTIGAVILVWRTLVATQKMVIETNRMANDARRIGEAQVRAYLSVKDFIVEAAPTTNDMYWLVDVTIANSGQSPARWVTISVEKENSRVKCGSIDLGEIPANSEVTENLLRTHGPGNEKGTFPELTFNVIVHAEDVFGKPVEISETFSGLMPYFEGARRKLDRQKSIITVNGRVD